MAKSSSVAKARKRDFVKVGSVKIAWTKFGDGRTCLDLRKWREKNARPTYKDHAEALREAQRLAIELNAGGADSQAITSADRASYAHAVRDVAPYGVPVHVATSEWGELQKKAAAIRKSVAEIFAAGFAAVIRPKHLVPVVVAELLNGKKLQDHKGRYSTGVTKTLTAFAAAFPGDIADVTPGQIETYLSELKIPTRKGDGTRRRDNILCEIRHLFRFAWERKYLPDEITAARQVRKINAGAGEITFFTPEQIELFIEHVAPEWLAFLLIAAFTGIRSEELCLARDAAKRKDSVRWEDFEWDDREINIRSEVAKTGTPRRVPILPNLWAWLAPWRDRHATGPVCPKRRHDKEFSQDGRLLRVINAARKAETRKGYIPGLEPAFEPVPWHNDGLRHSFGSYRLADIRDIEQLAEEMGNSPEIIRRHYHNPRPKRQALAYFAIMPPAMPDNVHQLHLPGVTTCDTPAGKPGRELSDGTSVG